MCELSFQMSRLQQLPGNLWRDIAYMMVATAYSDKSRDYTVSDAALQGTQQASGLPAVLGAWQTHHATQLYPGASYNDPMAAPGFSLNSSSGLPMKNSLAGFHSNVLPGAISPLGQPAYQPNGASPRSQPPYYG